MAKSKEYENAVVKATGTDEERRALALLQGDMAADMEEFDPRKIAQLIASGAVEVGQQIIELTEGMMIEGQLLGRGDPAMLDDPNNPGKLREVPTWRMKLKSGALVTFIGAAQLERMLPPFLGRKGNTIIARGATERTKKGRQLTHYYVVGPPAHAPRLIAEVTDIQRTA